MSVEAPVTSGRGNNQGRAPERREIEDNAIEFVLLYGRPSAGKGTQAGLLESRYPDDVALIATGDIFRSAGNPSHPLHKRYSRFADDTADIGAIMKSGGLVPDERMFPFSFDETAVQLENGKKVIVLDGVIRTPKQLEDFMTVFVPNFAQDLPVSVRHIFFDTSLEAVLSRAETRRKEDIAAGREPRPDDSEETVLKRQKTFDVETMPLIDELRRLGQLHEVDGSRSIEEVSDDVFGIVFEDKTKIMHPNPKIKPSGFSELSTQEKLDLHRNQHPTPPIDMDNMRKLWDEKAGIGADYGGQIPDDARGLVAEKTEKIVRDALIVQFLNEESA